MLPEPHQPTEPLVAGWSHALAAEVHDPDGRPLGLRTLFGYGTAEYPRV